MKITQTELFLTHVYSLGQYHQYGEFFLFSVHRFCPNVSLAPCFNKSMAKAHIYADHTDQVAQKISSYKCEIVCFFNLAIHF